MSDQAAVVNRDLVSGLGNLMFREIEHADDNANGNNGDETVQVSIYNSFLAKK